MGDEVQKVEYKFPEAFEMAPVGTMAENIALREWAKKLRDSLQGIIDIGKRDMANPKYDGYFESSKEVLTAFKAYRLDKSLPTHT